MKIKNVLVLCITMLLSGVAGADELMDAIENKENFKIHALVQKGFDLNKVYKKHGGFRKITPVVWAIKNENVMGLSYLLLKGASANSTGGFSDLPAIAQVAQTSKISTDKMLLMIDMLMKHGADINATSPDGSSVLHAAAYSNRPEVAQRYLDYGADKRAKDSDGKTGYDVAKMFKHKSVLDILKPGKDKALQGLQTFDAYNNSKVTLSPYVD